MKIVKLIVRDNKLNVGYNEVMLSNVAKGGEGHIGTWVWLASPGFPVGISPQ